MMDIRVTSQMSHLIHTLWLKTGTVDRNVIHAGDETGHVSLLLPTLSQLLLFLL